MRKFENLYVVFLSMSDERYNDWHHLVLVRAIHPHGRSYGIKGRATSGIEDVLHPRWSISSKTAATCSSRGLKRVDVKQHWYQYAKLESCITDEFERLRKG